MCQFANLCAFDRPYEHEQPRDSMLLTRDILQVTALLRFSGSCSVTLCGYTAIANVHVCAVYIINVFLLDVLLRRFRKTRNLFTIQAQMYCIFYTTKIHRVLDMTSLFARRGSQRLSFCELLSIETYVSRTPKCEQEEKGQRTGKIPFFILKIF